MKNEKVTNYTNLIKISTTDGPSLKDQLLFDGILRGSMHQRRVKTSESASSQFSHLINDRKDLRPERDKLTTEIDTAPSTAPQGTVTTMTIPVEWQHILQQIRLYLPTSGDLRILQANIKHDFLPHTALNIQKHNGVIIVQFVTDSSAMADRLLPQLRSLKIYLEKKLRTPVQVTLQMRSETSKSVPADHITPSQSYNDKT